VTEKCRSRSDNEVIVWMTNAAQSVGRESRPERNDGEAVTEKIALAGARVLADWANVLDHPSLAKKVYIAMLAADQQCTCATPDCRE
jgi:hypothetical protein